MYLRMLKKDLKDKVGLNIVLCLFMVIAATLLVMSTGFIYTFFAGIEKTYEKCNTSDVVFTVQKSISDEEGQRAKIAEVLAKYPEVGEILISERVVAETARLEFEGVDRRTVTNLYESEFVISPVSREQNIPYDRNDRLFELEDGCVAVPEFVASNAKTKIGSKLQITTDLGNTYELTVAYIYKDPSSNFLTKILFSDHDYAQLMQEFHQKSDLYEIKLNKKFSGLWGLRDWGIHIVRELEALGTEHVIDGNVTNVVLGKTNTASNKAMISAIISVFMVLMGISLIILIAMSIRFSLLATIKREEKEIGTMKAIGVDSLAYKTLFIVKYIAFAVIGGVAGTILGIPLARFMITNFIINTLSPEIGVFILLGLATSLIFVGIMAACTFAALRKMRKISVMDTIHGENRGERFKKLPGVYLHRSRKTSVPLFMALQDITGRIKRYLYLVISYTVGIALLFMVVQLKETVVNDSFRRTYWHMADREVFIRPDDNLHRKLIEQEGSYENVFYYYERYYNEHGIPLNIQILDMQEADLCMPEEDVAVYLYFGDADLSKLTIVKGGKTPELPNEVAVPHYLKNTRGIHLGDTITLEYKVYEEDGFTIDTVRKDYLVTAYIEDAVINSSPNIFMAQPDGDMVCDDWSLFNEGIDCADEEYAGYIEQMRAVNEDILIWDFDQLLQFDLGNEFGTILDLLTVMVAIIMAVTLFAQTFLYQQIFIEEETGDIAMLKSIGVDRKSVRGWHFDRIMLLVVTATVFAVLAAYTVNVLVFGKVGEMLLGVAEFQVAYPTVPALIVIPLGLAALIFVSLLISLKPMDSIQIWRVRNE
ncbi:MAG: FtsX-like permease family protein [Lachnospiraceae bacterium]|nr:FtsX-like permease family protein [Lachnospiraceae bacterium]